LTDAERSSFEAFYRENFKRLQCHAYQFLSNWADAEVVTQEAFYTAWKKYQEFVTSPSQLGWMKNTIQKVAANFTRAKRTRQKYIAPLDALSSPPSCLDTYPEVDSVEAHCAELLSAQEFALFQRAVIWKEPYPAVAEEFGLSESACRKRIQRIIRKLRKNW